MKFLSHEKDELDVFASFPTKYFPGNDRIIRRLWFRFVPGHPIPAPFVANLCEKLKQLRDKFRMSVLQIFFDTHSTLLATIKISSSV